MAMVSRPRWVLTCGQQWSQPLAASCRSASPLREAVDDILLIPPCLEATLCILATRGAQAPLSLLFAAADGPTTTTGGLWSNRRCAYAVRFVLTVINDVKEWQLGGAMHHLCGQLALAPSLVLSTCICTERAPTYFYHISF